MAMLIKTGLVMEDPWTLIKTPIENPLDYPWFSIIPWQVICQQKDLALPQAWIGVWFGVDINPDMLTPQVLDLPLLNIVIEDFTDGRAFTLIKQIRLALKYPGELRISGAFLIDQIALFRACGVDSFSLPDGSDYEHALFILQNSPYASVVSATDVNANREGV